MARKGSNYSASYQLKILRNMSKEIDKRLPNPIQSALLFQVDVSQSSNFLKGGAVKAEA